MTDKAASARTEDASEDPAANDAPAEDAQPESNPEEDSTEQSTEQPTEQPAAAPSAQDAKPGEYQVLARKYRPVNFTELKGQDALVRTLTNAITTGRVAHAFMLTGVRGVGKTTTARIIARALNCVGPDGQGGPTAEPCGVCEHCKSITSDRHVDVLEMDAASRTGVDDIREIIDSVQYSPSSARYKVYIIDEVHMLSKAAFNALLKTLEEPPEHVKFVFATTEIRKVPVTVLSRCQRFDLRRVDASVLSEYYAEIAEKEGVKIQPQALELISRAADGSVRDGLSLLDQAISLHSGEVDEELVRDMLGLADRTVVFDLYEAVMTGDSDKTFGILDGLHKSGAEPLVVLQDMLELTHFLTKARAVPRTADDATMPEAERVRGRELAEKLPMPVLTRTWQILLKGAYEVQQAPAPQQALEMVVIRLLYAAELPAPGDLVKQIKDGKLDAPQAPVQGGGQSTPSSAPAASSSTASAAPQQPQQSHSAPVDAPPPGDPVAQAVSSGNAATALAMQPDIIEMPEEMLDEDAEPALVPVPRDFAALVNLFGQKREALLMAHLHNYVHLVRYEPGQLEIRLAVGASERLPNQVREKLNEWTGRQWMVGVSREDGEPTLAEQEQARLQAEKDKARAHPIVAEVIKLFPGADITDIRNKS